MASGPLSEQHVVLRPGAAQDERAEPEQAEPTSAGELPLLDAAASDDFLRRWSDVQARFVDDPQAAVRAADALVTELVQALAAGFTQHKEGLEQSWRSGGEPGTEQLRLALQQYRSFFQRLLAT